MSNILSENSKLLGLRVSDELIIEILSYCTSPKDAFNLTRTCKTLQGIGKSRRVWLSLLQNLDVTQAPDITPYDQLDSLSTEVIISKVFRAVRLAHSMKTYGTLRYVQTDINPHVLQDNVHHVGCTYPQLLPDGRLELWALKPAASTPIWVAEGPNFCSVLGFELAQDGKALTVAAAYETQIGWIDQIWLTFLPLPGSSRTIEDIFSTPQLMVRANFVMVFFQTNEQIFLLNWKTHSGIELGYVEPAVPYIDQVEAQAALLGDHHIVIAANFGTEKLKLASISLSSLDGHWSQSSRMKEWKIIDYSSKIAQADEVEDQGVACLCLENIKDGQPMLFAMHAFTPAWRKNTDPNVPVPGEIFVVADRELSDESYQLQSYRIQLSARRVVAPDVTWRLSLVKQGCSATQLPLFCSDAQPANELSIRADVLNDTRVGPALMTVEPVSGALVIKTPDSLRVVQLE
ncbi:hypothetical protein DFH11DRAFT_1819090 [Phellopilus nigrolimitatus]|nr:hypothetical protein DFH11DRAFT_1819090 [Phellopilus nigrolimitatus]